MHLCQWFPDGRNRCNEPANKCVQFESTDGSEIEMPTIWLCDIHHGNPALINFWKGMSLRAHF